MNTNRSEAWKPVIKLPGSVKLAERQGRMGRWTWLQQMVHFAMFVLNIKKKGQSISWCIISK